MRIIFGRGEFIKKYTSLEIGIKESVLPITDIQLVYDYFHLFFIPFFATSKTWFYNSNGYWLKLDPEHEAHITSEYKHKLAPWYTFSGILLLLSIGIGYSIYDRITTITSINNSEYDLKLTQTKFIEKLNHLNENYYIGLENKTDGSTTSILYLKIEKISGQKITSSIINSENGINRAPFYVDSLYHNHKGNFDTISVTKENLVKAIPLKNDEGYNTSPLGVLIKEKKYSIIEVKEHNKPLLIRGNRSSCDTDGNFMFSFINELEEGTLIDIVNDKSTKLNWKTKLPFKIPSGSMTSDKNDLRSIFELYGTGYKAKQTFQFVLKCIDRKNKKVNYLVKGDSSDYEIEEVY